MWFLDGRAVTDVITKNRSPSISYREWLLCNLNPEGAGPLGARFQKLVEMSDEELEAYRCGKIPLPAA